MRPTNGRTVRARGRRSCDTHVTAVLKGLKATSVPRCIPVKRIRLASPRPSCLSAAAAGPWWQAWSHVAVHVPSQPCCTSTEKKNHEVTSLFSSPHITQCFGRAPAELCAYGKNIRLSLLDPSVTI